MKTAKEMLEQVKKEKEEPIAIKKFIEQAEKLIFQAMARGSYATQCCSHDPIVIEKSFKIKDLLYNKGFIITLSFMKGKCTCEGSTGGVFIPDLPTDMVLFNIFWEHLK